jgi:hypothetical protein
MTSNTMNAPADVNTVYDMANSWVRTQSIQRHGTSTTFVTTLDKPGTKPGSNGKKPEAEKTATNNQEGKVTPPGSKDNIKCFNCQKKGHYANKCPEKKKTADDTSEDDDHLRTLHATWDASVHVTTRVVQVHSAVKRRMKSYLTIKWILVLSIQGYCNRSRQVRWRLK